MARGRRLLLPLMTLLALLIVSAGVVAAWASGNPAGMEAAANRLLPRMANYDDPDGPLYSGAYAADNQEDPAELVVVTYNLRYAEDIAGAIAAWRAANPLPLADIVLLQEMDPPGVELLARELDYNYVYYPASIAEDGDDFGNAILARWPISDPHKLILPGRHPITGQMRAATRAVVHVGERDVLVYSTHIEVATATPALRAGQVAAIVKDIPDDAAYVIVGGDFNTVTRRGVDSMAELFAAVGLEHATADLGPTFTRFGLRPSATDHLFSRGFERVDAGVLGDITASDHFPVWARLGLPARLTGYQPSLALESGRPGRFRRR